MRREVGGGNCGGLSQFVQLYTWTLGAGHLNVNKLSVAIFTSCFIWSEFEIGMFHVNWDEIWRGNFISLHTTLSSIGYNWKARNLVCIFKSYNNVYFFYIAIGLRAPAWMERDQNRLWFPLDSGMEGLSWHVGHQNVSKPSRAFFTSCLIWSEFEISTFPLGGFHDYWTRQRCRRMARWEF